MKKIDELVEIQQKTVTNRSKSSSMLPFKKNIPLKHFQIEKGEQNNKRY